MKMKPNYYGKSIRQIADIDVKNIAIQWEEKSIKPGELFLKSESALVVSALEEQRDENSQQTAIKVSANEYAKLNEMQNNDEVKTKILDQYQEKESQLTERKERLEKSKAMLVEKRNVLKYSLPEEEPQPEIKKAMPEIKEKKERSGYLLLFVLIAFCLYDGMNMFFGLNNFKYNLLKNAAIAITSFGFVLFGSLFVKKNNDVMSWIIFLIALSVSNIPQFLGHPVTFSLSNLTSNPDNIIAFAISFIGSISVTVMNARDMSKKSTAIVAIPVPEIIVQPLSEEEKHAIKTYRQFENRIAEVEKELNQIITAIEKLEYDKEKQMNEIEERGLQGKKEKLEALMQFQSDIKQLEAHSKKLEQDIADEKENLKERLLLYRAEVELLLLLRDIAKEAHFVDLNTIL
jgi:hypothetical protein